MVAEMELGEGFAVFDIAKQPGPPAFLTGTGHRREFDLSEYRAWSKKRCAEKVI